MSGDDDGGGLVVVDAADGDAVSAGPHDAVVDGVVEHLGGAGEWLGGGSASGCGGEDGGGGAATEAAVGAVVVVVGDELVELGLELVDARGRVVGGEPSFEGLVEAFDFAAGLGVIGPRVAKPDPERGEVVVEAGPERGAVVGEEPFRPTVSFGGVGDGGPGGCEGAAPSREGPHHETGAVVETVDDLDVGAVGECPVG